MHHLIFDFDGVIGDTREASAHATAHVNSITMEEAYRQNNTYARSKPNHVRNHTLTDHEMQAIYSWTVRFGEVMRGSDFPLFSDFIKEIESIHTPHKAIVSTGSQKYIAPSLEKTQINPTHILTYENHHSKEEKIETICRDWGVESCDVFYFTDTLADIFELRDMLAPNKLIAVSWGYCTKEELAQELDEKYILQTPHDIHKVLEYA
jgi:phosphoglycolate phosphatase-like HAD superfamily hydrolase